MTKSLSVMDDDMEVKVEPEEEECARNFLNKFKLNDEGSATSQINLVLFFKAVPFAIKHEKSFNFQLFQESLVAYKNKEDVNAFEYHDEKNRDRVALVKNQLSDQRNSLRFVKEALTLLENTMEKGAQKLGKVFDDEQNQKLVAQNKDINF